MTTVSADRPPRASRPAGELDAARSRLLTGRHLPLTVGAVALVTLAAFENRAITTAMPSIVADFDALAAFGLATAAPTASFLAVLGPAGAWADRRGPGPVLRAGIAVFALAQVLVGLAVSMPMVVAGRLLSGVAEALLDIALMVLVARVLPAALRPRMMGVFAAAWVLPSVLGPVLTGVVTEQVGWRWVFLGAFVLLVPAALALRPAVRLAAGGTAVRGEAATGRRTAGWSLAAAGALLVLSLAGTGLGSAGAATYLVIVAAAVGLAVSVARLLPPGTLRGAPGLPSVIGVRALLSAAFGGAGAFLPLLLTVLHGFGPSRAGVTLSITGVMWGVGSWLQGRDHRLPRVTVLRTGLATLSAGLVGTGALAATGLSVWWGLAGWAVAGLGMGISSSTTAVLVLDLSADHEQGRNNGAAQTAASTSMAIAIAVGGTLLALAEKGSAAESGAGATGGQVLAFALILAAGAASAVLALLLSLRVRATSSSG